MGAQPFPMMRIMVMEPRHYSTRGLKFKTETLPSFWQHFCRKAVRNSSLKNEAGSRRWPLGDYPCGSWG